MRNLKPEIQYLKIQPNRIFTALEKFARDKHSSLLRKLINYGRKKFYNIGPEGYLLLVIYDVFVEQAAVIKLFTSVIYEFS